MGDRNLRTFSFLIKIPNRHSWAEAKVFSGDQTIGVFLQVLEAKRDTDKKTKVSKMELNKNIILVALLN